jgi:hypothetical protein
MSGEKSNWPANLYRFIVRFSMIGAFAIFIFLCLTLLTFVGRLESLAPAELRLLLEVVKNRFFR